MSFFKIVYICALYAQIAISVESFSLPFVNKRDNKIHPATRLESYIETIQVRNFGGMLNGLEEEETEEITIPIGNEPNFVAVTGETGSGKSLLIAKAIEYIMGCKASSSIVPRVGGKDVSLKVGAFSLIL